MRTLALLAVTCGALASPAALVAQDGPIRLPLADLIRGMPIFLNREVEVDGYIVGWGELAALDTEQSREIMVDLRNLPAEVRDELNRVCKPGLACTGTVRGPIVHIRGDMISELGINAQSVRFVAWQGTGGTPPTGV